MAAVTLLEATRLAVRQEMRRDPRVWVLGEDVARGGLWGQYKGFADEFGPERAVSTPISEATIMGAGLGAALVGTRPIIEMRIFDFVMCAMDELVNQIAKIRYMFGGQAKPAVVVRMPHGMWRNSAAQHSQMLEAWFAHLPGVIVATPSSAADAAGLLVAAIRCDDPVLFFDPKDLWTAPGEIGEPIEPIPFGAARKLHDGDAATVVTWSAAVPVAAEAAALLAAEGIATDLLDLRTIWPWDEEAVVASVTRTGRLLVVHEAVEVAGFGAEVVARVIERVGPAALKAVKRLAAPRIPVPFSPPLEAEVRLSPAKVVAAVQALLL
jgi:acetoin:2,6-dichlorophenolindophenol oxidoreductase subunit beta